MFVQCIVYCVQCTPSPLWLKSVPGWPAISVSTWQESRVGQIVWFGCLSAISQLASREGEGGGVRQLSLHRGCTLQINEPQLQCSKHQRATHQRLSTSTVSGWSSEHSGCTKSSADQRLYTSMKTRFFLAKPLRSVLQCISCCTYLIDYWYLKFYWLLWKEIFRYL